MKFKLSGTVILLSTIMVLISSQVLAQAWEERLYNPKKDDNDFILPMPCDGAMVFRKIDTSAKGPFDDMRLNFKSADGSDTYISNIQEYLSGGFSGDKAGANRFFYLAKYELTALQYKAVMEGIDGQCPKPSMELRKPMVNISWFDANDFINKYNLWLLKNKPDSLPQEDGQSGYVRLPADVEWEFAARGGLGVASNELVGKTFPLKEGGVNEYVWYAGSKSANGRLQVTGNKLPNPLGLYDILGNASEMVADSFRLTKGNRYQGQRGGFIVRGGSYLTPEGQISVSERIEKSFYSADNKDATKSGDIGMRVAIGAPVITSQNKLEVIKAEAAKGENDSPAVNIVSQIDELSAASKENDQLNKLVEKLKKDVMAANQQRDEQENITIKSFLSNGAFLCVNIYNSNKNLGELKEQLKSMLNALQKDSDNKDINDAIDILKPKILEANQYHNILLDQYFDVILSVADDYPPKKLQQQYDQAMADIDSGLNAAATQIVKDKFKLQNRAYKVFKKHFDGYSKNGIKAAVEWTKECSVL